MAIFKTDTALLQDPPATSPTDRAPGGRVSGDIAYMFGTYTFLGTETAADFIEVGVLPIGARPLPHLSKIMVEAGAATALVGTVGTVGVVAGTDYASLSTSVTLTAGGQFDFAGIPAYTLVPTMLAENTQVFFDPTTITTPVAGKRISFLVAYSCHS